MNETVNRFIDDNIKTDLILKERANVLPKAVVPTIQPVYEVLNRFTEIVRDSTSASTGAILVYTTPSDRDFFLTGFLISYVKNATCDVATGRLSLSSTINGTSRSLGSFAVLTTTAQDGTLAVVFPNPIKLDRNVGISLAGTFTAGAMSRSVHVYGYTNLQTQPQLLTEA